MRLLENNINLLRVGVLRVGVLRVGELSLLDELYACFYKCLLIHVYDWFINVLLDSDWLLDLFLD